MKESIRESLRKLQTEYIDLVLIHQSFNEGNVGVIESSDMPVVTSGNYERYCG